MTTMTLRGIDENARKYFDLPARFIGSLQEQEGMRA